MKRERLSVKIIMCAAVLGMMNNINQFGFSFGDYMSFSGGLDGMSGGGGSTAGNHRTNVEPLPSSETSCTRP